MYTNDYNRDSYDISRQSQAALANTVSSAMKRVYFKMTLALVVTALTALWASSSYGYLSFIASHTWMMWVLIAAESASYSLFQALSTSSRVWQLLLCSISSLWSTV